MFPTSNGRIRGAWADRIDKGKTCRHEIDRMGAHVGGLRLEAALGGLSSFFINRHATNWDDFRLLMKKLEREADGGDFHSTLDLISTT